MLACSLYEPIVNRTTNNLLVLVVEERVEEHGDWSPDTDKPATVALPEREECSPYPQPHTNGEPVLFVFHVYYVTP